jgi:superfamily II DNA or RNA helicase
MKLRPHQERATDAMKIHPKGQLIVPTGGGKTLKMIFDTLRNLESDIPQTIVVVAPRILLANQLCSEFLEFITNASVMHIHSGETHYFSSTKPQEIADWVENTQGHKLIFTTYHSLDKLQVAQVSVDTIYFDEAHNSVQRNFFGPTEYFSQQSSRCYFFTATPKHSLAVGKPGMNDVDVYGQVICNVPAPELVQGGFILPPKVIAKQLPMVGAGKIPADRDCDNLIETLDECGKGKVLICAKATKQIVALVAETDFIKELQSRGYSYLYITAKTGAVIDGQKVNREVFFDTLSAWGKDDNKKFVVLHHSILSEGINVSGLEGVIFMRSMDYIGISQTIGRVIRMHKDDAEGIRNGTLVPGDVNNYTKSYGLVVVPVFNKVGISTHQKIQSVVDTIFQQGQPAISVVRK